MNSTEELLAGTAEELFEEAPCGYLVSRPDGTILRVNRTFEAMTGLSRADLVERRRFRDLLAPGAQIYHETHFAPLLRMQGQVSEIAVEIVRADGSRLAALVNATLTVDERGEPRLQRMMVFDASDRRRYEEELLRARREEREVGLALQRSLLSGELPVSPKIDIDVAYQPAEAGLEVGGDWYDAFWIERDRTVGLVVGDVVGRGIEAAATMGQLRSAVRALAGRNLGPGALLDALDGFTARHRIGRMTTIVVAVLDLDTLHLRYACAGHPPPVILMPGEEPLVAWEGRSVPVDCYAGVPARDEGGRDLVPGSAVLLYTDGLIETRSATLAEGIARLRREADAHRDESAAAMSAAVMHTLRDTEHPDDVCLLIARVLSD